MLCVLTVTATVLNALISPKDNGIKRRLHRVEKAWGWRNGRQKFVNNLTDSRFCMSQQGNMVAKRSGHNCVCTIRYKVCRIKNVRGDGLFLFCVDQSPRGIGHLFWAPYSEWIWLRQGSHVLATISPKERKGLWLRRSEGRKRSNSKEKSGDERHGS